jgi:type IV secretory pathway VirB6-like protein
MAQSGQSHGHMDIQDQRDTYAGFLSASLWSGGLIVQGIALATLAFAIGSGWWPGLAAFVAIGVAIGLLFRMSGVYWAVQIVIWVLLGIGGLVVPALAGLMG